MDELDFLDDLRWCSRCGAYVPYMASYQGAYCAYCDRRVAYLRREDWAALMRAGTLPKRSTALRSGTGSESATPDVDNVLLTRHEHRRRSRALPPRASADG